MPTIILKKLVNLPLVVDRRTSHDESVQRLPINYVEAIRLYRKAADLGHLQARKMLDLIFSQSADTGTINIFWMQRLSRIDVSGYAPQLPTVDGPVLLAREETGLTDFIPRIWTNVYRATNQNLAPCQPLIAPC